MVLYWGVQWGCTGEYMTLFKKESENPFQRFHKTEAFCFD